MSLDAPVASAALLFDLPEITAAPVVVVARFPILYFLRSRIASAECPASLKAFVQSIPAQSVTKSGPPG